MSEPTLRHVAVTIPDGFTRAELLTELDREIAIRSRVYPQWVASGKMTATTAQRQTERLRAIRGLVAQASDAPPAQPDLFGARK